jgi:hypothetical protein
LTREGKVADGTHICRANEGKKRTACMNSLFLAVIDERPRSFTVRDTWMKYCRAERYAASPSVTGCLPAFTSAIACVFVGPLVG